MGIWICLWEAGVYLISYGVTPQSYLYHNDGNGHFTDVAAATEC